MQNIFSRATVDATSRVLIRGADTFGNFFASTSVASELGTPTVSPSGPVLVLSDYARGFAALDFTSSSVGTFEVSVHQFGEHVIGSPFTLEVQEQRAPDLSQTQTWGSAIDGENSSSQLHPMHVCCCADLNSAYVDVTGVELLCCHAHGCQPGVSESNSELDADAAGP